MLAEIITVYSFPRLCFTTALCEGSLVSSHVQVTQVGNLEAKFKSIARNQGKSCRVMVG